MLLERRLQTLRQNIVRVSDIVKCFSILKDGKFHVVWMISSALLVLNLAEKFHLGLVWIWEVVWIEKKTQYRWSNVAGFTSHVGELEKSL